jgi:hypothetical protein
MEVEPGHTRHGDLADTIARRSGPLGEEICSPERIVGPSCPEQGLAQLGFEGEVELVRRHERGCALEQAHGGTVVLPADRTVAAGYQAPSRLGGQGAVVGCLEIGAVATGDLEVVAEELVQLDELGPVLLQPGREALVEACPGGFRERVVGSVADEDVAEAETVLSENKGTSGVISSLRTSAARRDVTCISSGASAWTAPRWKTSPSIAPRSSTLRSAIGSWSILAASSAWSVGARPHGRPFREPPPASPR